jgi:S-adenosylmethionine:diacylglycerol 3-amino-3-carboxypropyl transferase
MPQYQNISMISEKELTELKKRLPRGYFKKTLEKAGMSERSIANFFSGKSYNLDIHRAAVEVAEEYECEKNAVIKRSKAISHG